MLLAAYLRSFRPSMTGDTSPGGFGVENAGMRRMDSARRMRDLRSHSDEMPQ